MKSPAKFISGTKQENVSTSFTSIEVGVPQAEKYGQPFLLLENKQRLPFVF
jgi:hypothetical protein